MNTFWGYWRSNMSLSSLVMRRALRMAIAVLITAWVYHWFGYLSTFWMVLSLIIVMHDSSGRTLRKGVQRFVALIIGIVVGTWFLTWFKPSWELAIAVLVVISALYYVKIFNRWHRRIMIAPLTLLIGFTLAVLIAEPSHLLMLRRCYDAVFGAMIGILASFALFPNTLNEEVGDSAQETLKQSAFYIGAVLQALAGDKEALERVSRQKQLFFEWLTKNRRYCDDWAYEVGQPAEERHRYHTLVSLVEQIAQILSSLELQAERGLLADIRERLEKPLRTLDDKIKHIIATICMQNKQSPMLSTVASLQPELILIEQTYEKAMLQNKHEAAMQVLLLLYDLVDLERTLSGMYR